MDDAKKQFMRIYPDATILDIEKVNNAYVFRVELPNDGTFYFVVVKNTISRSYDTKIDAITAINKEHHND